MPDKIFVDSNIFLYAFSIPQNTTQHDAVFKHEIAKKLIQNNAISISTQVINEVSVNMLKKLRYSNEDIHAFVESCYRRYTILNFSEELFLIASALRERYHFSYYDSLIVSAALQSNATILYSEDMHNGLIVDEQLQIVNPFQEISHP